MTVPKRFGVLRFFGMLMKVIAWIMLALSVLAAIGAVIAGNSAVVTNALTQFLPEGVLIGAGGGFLIGIMVL